MLPFVVPEAVKEIVAPAVTSLMMVMEPPPDSVRLKVPVEAVAPLASELQLQVMRLTFVALESSMKTEPLPALAVRLDAVVRMGAELEPIEPLGVERARA